MFWTWAAPLPTPWFPPPGWTWPNVITAAISLVALFLSVATFRQRVRYHPQPRLDVLWPSAVRVSEGVPYLNVQIVNNGDSAARDVHLVANTLAKDSKLIDSTPVLEPGSGMNLIVPVIMGTKATSDFALRLEAPQSGWQPVRPVLTVTWREAPFRRRKPRRLRQRSPKIPGIDAYKDMGSKKAG